MTTGRVLEPRAAGGRRFENKIVVVAGAGQGIGSDIYAVTPLSNGQILIGGGFLNIDGHGQSGLARLQSDGSLVGWGWNYGEEASGTGGTFYGQATPPVGTNFVAISAGFEYSLAIQVVIERPVLNIARYATNLVTHHSPQVDHPSEGG